MNNQVNRLAGSIGQGALEGTLEAGNRPDRLIVNTGYNVIEFQPGPAGEPVLLQVNDKLREKCFEFFVGSQLPSRN